jgi:two-component system, OmpR family, sensor histidine kinase CpxA
MFSVFNRTLALRFLVQLISYALLLVLLPVVFFNARFGLGWEALLRSPAGERVDAVSEAVVSQLANTDFEKWSAILDNFGSIYQVKFYLLDLSGGQLAGEPVKLPYELVHRLESMVPALPPMHHLQRLENRHFRHWHGRSENFLELPDYVFEVDPPGPDRILQDDHMPPPAPPPRELPMSWFSNNSRFLVHTKNPESFWICTKVMMNLPELGRPIPLILMASTDNLWKSTLLVDLKMAALAIGLILTLSVLFWLPFIYQLTKSLSQVVKATELIAEGRFETRVKTGSEDEIGRLADAVNSMAARINSYVTGQKRLLGDISHELCSPIARLQMALELLQESASEEQQGLLQDIREEVNEMNSLVSELLAFSKAEIKGASSNLSTLALKPLIEATVARCGAPEKISIAVASDVSVMAEANLLDRALSNLLRNSLRYAGEQAHITITASYVCGSGATSNDRGDKIAIVIRDNGPGVPEDSLASLGEPFFRPEASRNRSFGGVGLGLAIVRSCVAACHGSTVIRNVKPHGLEVEISLASA